MYGQTLKVLSSMVKRTLAEITSFKWKLTLRQLVCLKGNICNYLDGSRTFNNRTTLITAIYLVNFRKCAEQVFNGIIEAATSDFICIKPQSQVICAVRKQLLQYLLNCTKFKDYIFLHGHYNVIIVKDIPWERTEKIMFQEICTS